MKTKLLILIFTLISGYTIIGDRVIELKRDINTVECAVCHYITKGGDDE
jgi:hypothetical protein